MKNLFFLLPLLGCFLLSPVTILAWECDVTLDAPKTIKLDQEVTLSAEGTPEDGSYSWSRTPKLTPDSDDGKTAKLIGHKPNHSEYIQVIAYYRTPKGKKCKDTAWIWACICSLEDITGKGSAKVGEEVDLSTSSDSSGGTYTWTVNSGSGSIPQAKIKNTQLPTVTITDEPDIGAPGNSSTLTWSSEHAVFCSIEPGIGDVQTSGSVDVAPTEITI